MLQTRRMLRLLTVLVVLAVGALAGAGVSQGAKPKKQKHYVVAPDNPLTQPWGLYRSDTRVPSNDPPSAYWNLTHDPLMQSYLNTFRFRWFGAWVGVNDTGHGATLKWGARRTAREYATQIQEQSGPNALVPVGIFRLDPYEHALIHDHKVANTAQQQQYRAWMTEFLGGLRDANARTVIVLQPDMPLTLGLPHHSKLYLNMIKWTVGQINATLPTATTYIDAGASDWLSARSAANMLKAAGVASVRGFSLNITHYASTRNEVAYGKQIIGLLNKAGIKGKHFVVSTALNGKPFTHYGNTYTFQHGSMCATRKAKKCVTVGQPSTLNTGTRAADAFLWIGRNWYNNAAPRSQKDLRQLLRTSPWFH